MKAALLASLIIAPTSTPEGNVDKWYDHADAHPEALPDKHLGNEVFYQIFVDRFANGNPANDCPTDARFCDPSHKDFYKYWGGDLRGIIGHLPYLKTLGVTRLWLTPIFENDEVTIKRNRYHQDIVMSSYHGYWMRDWFRLNPHFTDHGDQDYQIVQELADQAGPEIKIVLDTVANHSSPTDPTPDSIAWLDGEEPLGQVDGKPRTHRGAIFRDGAYVTSWDEDQKTPAGGHAHFHHNGPITDWNNTFQLENYQLDALNDIDQTDPVMSAYLRDAHEFWMDKIPGLAGYRMDTIKHVNQSYWTQFDHDFFGKHPDKEIVGEWFGGGPGVAGSQTFYKTTHMTMFDFEFRQALVDVFQNGQPITKLEQVWSEDPNLIDARSLVTFLDNHDLPRLRGQGVSRSTLEQALVTLFASRGVPCVYYGMEQDLYTPNDPGDPFNRPMMTSFDTNAEIYKLVQKLTGLRAANPALRYGRTHVVHESDKILAFERVDGDHRVFFATSTNPGAGNSFEIDHLTLPDGKYDDVLNGKSYAVAGGKIHVDLHQGDVVLLSRP